jgi:hypothetical protein
VHPPPSPDWANFSTLMECTPESGRCHSVYSVVLWKVAKKCCLIKVDIGDLWFQYLNN